MASRVASATSIYFCGSIRAGRQDVDLYQRIIQKLEKFGQVLTPFVGDKSITIKGSEREGGDKGIHDYDVGLLQRSDCKYFTVSTSVKSSFWRDFLREELIHLKTIATIFIKIPWNELQTMSSSCYRNLYFVSETVLLCIRFFFHSVRFQVKMYFFFIPNIASIIFFLSLIDGLYMYSV